MTNQERLERIELPEELDQLIQEAVDQGRKRKSQVIWKRAGLGCMGAAAAFAVLLSAGFVSPVAAQAFEGIPAVGKVFTYLYDLTGYEGRYAQVADDARSALPAERQEADGEGPLQGGTTAGRQEAAGQQEAAGPQGTAGQQGDDSQQNVAAQKTVMASDAGITIIVKEYFCDKQSLYLSMVIGSEEPFFEDGVEENTKGHIQLFTKDETVSYEGMDSFSVGNSSLLAEGVYLDDHTFVGIARSEWSNVRQENITVPDELIYTASIKHLKIYTENGTPDFRGEWELSMNVFCEKDAIEVLPVDATAEDGSSICEVRLQPYEVQIATKTGKSGTVLTEEMKTLIAFDEQGNRLDHAGSILSYGEEDKEIYEYARPENLGGLDLFILDEASWLDQWKGRLYDGTMTGPEMVEFLKENCILHVFVNCKN